MESGGAGVRKVLGQLGKAALLLEDQKATLRSLLMEAGEEGSMLATSIRGLKGLSRDLQELVALAEERTRREAMDEDETATAEGAGSEGAGAQAGSSSSAGGGAAKRRRENEESSGSVGSAPSSWSSAGGGAAPLPAPAVAAAPLSASARALAVPEIIRLVLGFTKVNIFMRPSRLEELSLLSKAWRDVTREPEFQMPILKERMPYATSSFMGQLTLLERASGDPWRCMVDRGRVFSCMDELRGYSMDVEVRRNGTSLSFEEGPMVVGEQHGGLFLSLSERTVWFYNRHMTELVSWSANACTIRVVVTERSTGRRRPLLVQYCYLRIKERNAQYPRLQFVETPSFRLNETIKASVTFCQDSWTELLDDDDDDDNGGGGGGDADNEVKWWRLFFRELVLADVSQAQLCDFLRAKFAEG